MIVLFGTEGTKWRTFRVYGSELSLKRSVVPSMW